VLVDLISETKQSLEMLNHRCDKVKDIVDLYESKIQYDDLLCLKDKDVDKLNEHITSLTDSLKYISTTELQLNEKNRELTKLQHEFSFLKSKCETLTKQNNIFSNEL
jgi:archaellum component FlaC